MLDANQTMQVIGRDGRAVVHLVGLTVEEALELYAELASATVLAGNASTEDVTAAYRKANN